MKRLVSPVHLSVKKVFQFFKASAWIAALVILNSAPVVGAELVTLKTFLKNELGSQPKISKESLPLKAEDKATLASLAPDAQDTEFVFYYGRTAENQLAKACTVVPQAGKEGPMTIGVCFDSAGLVTGVTVLTSEEERGKAVAEEGFIKQFHGKKVSDAFQVGQDVNGVSGATWSSKAVSEAIRKSAFAFRKYVRGQK
jgi:Na+-translocating ferredoxin:NAD+ oxidoreductase RnfG subunit